MKIELQSLIAAILIGVLSGIVTNYLMVHYTCDKLAGRYDE